jgi:hypothetical protein
MIDLAFIRFMLADALQILKIILIVTIPVALLVIAALWIFARRSRSPDRVFPKIRE